MKKAASNVWYWCRLGFWYLTYPYSPGVLLAYDPKEWQREERAWLARMPKRREQKGDASDETQQN